MVGVDVGFRAAHVFSWKLARLCTLKKKTNRQHLGQNKLEKHVCVDLLKMLGTSKKKVLPNGGFHGDLPWHKAKLCKNHIKHIQVPPRNLT